MLTRTLLKIAFFSGALAFAQGASAATFSAFVGGGLTGGCGTESEQVINSDTPVDLVTGGGGQGCSTDVKARASAGSVGVLANFSSDRPTPLVSSTIGSVRASATFTDRIFIVPEGGTLADAPGFSLADYRDGVDAQGLMTVGLNFGFTGTVGAGTSSATSFKGKSALAELELLIDVSATTGGCCGVYDPFDYYRRDFELASATEVIRDFANVRTISRSFSHVPTAGLTVRLQMNALASVGGFGGSTDLATATASSMNSLGYVKTGPVLNLPTGFTAFSTSGAIVNNRLVTTPSVAAVPLPAGMPLLLAGLGAFALMRRRAAA